MCCILTTGDGCLDGSVIMPVLKQEKEFLTELYNKITNTFFVNFQTFFVYFNCEITEKRFEMNKKGLKWTKKVKKGWKKVVGLTLKAGQNTQQPCLFQIAETFFFC